MQTPPAQKENAITSRLSPLEFATCQLLRPLFETSDSTAHGALVVLVSGGLDSMVLLHVLAKAVRARRGWKSTPPPSLVALHCNHGTRPASNAEDEALVAAACLDWGVDLHIVRARAFVEGNFQNAARSWRYAEAERVRALLAAQVSGPVFVATAHHARDAVESMLLHLVRGCGPEGLQGFAEVDTPRGLVRPFASVPHATIERYAAASGVPWRDDPSNASNAYARNRVRHDVLPVLAELNPEYERAFAQCAHTIRDLLVSLPAKRPPFEQHPKQEECFVPLSDADVSPTAIARACRGILHRQTRDAMPHFFASLLRALGRRHWENLATHVAKARAVPQAVSTSSSHGAHTTGVVVPLPLGATAVCFDAGIAFRRPPPATAAGGG